MASASAQTEPRTLEEMNARYRAAREANAEAARRLAEMKRAKAAADDKAAKARADIRAMREHHRERQKAAHRAAQKAALDARVFAVLDPDKLAREPKRIIARIAAERGFTAADILGPRRGSELIAARFAAVATVAEANPGLSLSQMGRHFNRHHTTILHVLRRIGIRTRMAGPEDAPTTAPQPRDPGVIMAAVAAAHGVPVSALKGGGQRSAHVTIARWDAMAAIAKEHPLLSAGAIGRLFSCGHGTVLSALRTHGLRLPASTPST